jgi:outer membrane receptor protein involved in Fe transport
MNGGLTAELLSGFSTALRVRFLDDRPANENRSLTARGYTLLDLVAKYRWRNVEASLALLNLTNTDWREAQFADTSCVRGELRATGPCAFKPGKQGSHPDPAADIHFTPGNPLGVRAGLTLFF